MEDKKNQNLLQLVKRVHGFVENTDLEKHRQSQDYFGSLLSSSRDVKYEEIFIDEMHGEWVRLKKTHRKDQVILYCHGGGYSTGSSVYGRSLTAKFARNMFTDVLSFDYRLAPEHPYPAAVEDGMKAWDYLMYLGYGAENVVVTGDSAGGNLALVLVQTLIRQHRKVPKAVILLSPWTDLTCSGDSFTKCAPQDPVLDAAYISQMIRAYAKNRNLKDPGISPLFGNFEGFPPTLIQAGENEILLDDATRLAEKMKKADVRVKIKIFPGMWHVFQMSPFKTAYDALGECAQFIFDI